MKKLLCFILASSFYGISPANAGPMTAHSEAKLFRYSTTIEKERPKLNEKTLKLIAAYRANPTQANENALRKQIAANYDEVIARKKAKLKNLRETAREQSKIDEMEKIIKEMLNDRENRIEQSFRRFTDRRLKPGSRNAKDGYLPVMGAEQNVYIAHTPVTNGEYSAFVNETQRKAPKNWINGNYPNGQEKYPVIYVSYNDAAAYCNWLTQKDHSASYRLPTEQEWELAAGHMPKDADMNAGEDLGLTPVTAYSQTLSASGAIDMWGNVWEWTSTSGKQNDTKAVKGGAWNTQRTLCRTEYREESRDINRGYNNVGFRVIKINIR